MSKPLEDDWQAYVYRLAADATEKFDPVSSTSQELVKNLVRHVRNEHGRTLELAPTVDFLEQREGLPREAAMERALRLKPACRSYLEPTRRLVKDLNLA